MIDSNERLTYLNSRNTNKLVERMINSTLSAYIQNKTDTKVSLNTNILKQRQESIKNALFIKFCNIEYEGLFQRQSIDRKMGG